MCSATASIPCNASVYSKLNQIFCYSHIWLIDYYTLISMLITWLFVNIDVGSSWTYFWHLLDIWPLRWACLFAVRIGKFFELPQQQGILEDPLNGFDQTRLDGGRMLLLWIAWPQEVLKRDIALWKFSRWHFEWNQKISKLHCDSKFIRLVDREQVKINLINYNVFLFLTIFFLIKQNDKWQTKYVRWSGTK